MGRPLKIAKAQAVLTITATTSGTNLVTVSQSLTTSGVIKNMPFVPATTVGGLIGGTTYWVLNISDANHFTVSSTPLNANPNSTAFTLTSTTGQTVAATVGLVDSGFSNPNGGNTSTNATTYGVVGGNTALYGSQVLATVAIGKAGVGTIYTVSNASTYLYGVGTDFANNMANNTVIQFPVANVNGIETDYVTVGYSSATFGNIEVAVANSTATGNVIGTSGNAQLLTVSQPVIFDTGFGGLSANTTYFVKTIANAAAFTVSSTQGGVPISLSSNASVTANAFQDQVVLTANALTTGSNSAFIQATPEPGFIKRQKGKTKYLVQGSVTGLVSQCFTSNTATLLPNTMNIIATYANSANAYVKNLSDYNSEVFYYVTAGSFVSTDTYIIQTVGTTDFTLIGAVSNTPGLQFVATGAGSGTGTAVLANAQPNVVGSFGNAYAGNTYAGQPNPIVTINSL